MPRSDIVISKPPLHPGDIGVLVALVNQDRLREAEHKAVELLRVHPAAGMLWKILSVVRLRQGADALQALRKTVELMPQDAEAHGNLGAALYDQGHWAGALASSLKSLDIQPQSVEVLLDAANSMKALGRAQEAVPLYQRALRLRPLSAEAQNNLGNALLELGQFRDAADCYQRALDIKPEDAQVLCNLSNALREVGRFDEAMRSTQRALALDPTLSVAHNNLGLILAALGQREEAVSSYQRALNLNGDYVEALNNLGTAQGELGQRREAAATFLRAIEIDPQRAESHCYLGNVLVEFRRTDEAEASFKRALELNPRYTLAFVSLGAVQRQQGRFADAEQSCRAALAIDPQFVAALSLLGELHADQGRFIEAQALFRQVLKIDADFAFAFFSIATHRKMTSDDADWRQGVERLLAKRVPLRHEISLRYALGKYFDDLKQYDDAFDSYRQANDLTKRYGAFYDRAKLTQRVDRVISCFDEGFLRECRSVGNASPRPVFIVGMPRSGTSLSEQILASHPAVFGAGELIFWQARLAGYLAEAGHAARRETLNSIAEMARDYLQRLNELSGDAERVVDKMPLNFMNVGLIHAAFPQAKIIHLRRHPIDTCLSIYFQYFSYQHRYANDLDSLAHFFTEYQRVMEHWRGMLPTTTLLEVPYDELIEDQEVWSRRMVEFIGQPWDPKCLDFHQTERSVITLSKWQVRQKIHTASSGRWRHYEKHVGPLLRLLTSAASTGR